MKTDTHLDQQKIDFILKWCKEISEHFKKYVVFEINYTFYGHSSESGHAFSMSLEDNGRFKFQTLDEVLKSISLLHDLLNR